MSDKREADKIVRNQLPQLLNPHKKQKIKNSEDMTATADFKQTAQYIGLAKWLTGEEVCRQLRISPRTLAKLRDRGFIGYSQIGYRFYYKPEDVKRVIPLVGTIYPADR